MCTCACLSMCTCVHMSVCSPLCALPYARGQCWVSTSDVKVGVNDVSMLGVNIGCQHWVSTMGVNIVGCRHWVSTLGVDVGSLPRLFFTLLFEPVSLTESAIS